MRDSDHPSCEGGTSTGTHVHIARKFNGEWIAIQGPLPFVLSGWQAFASEKNYQGGMLKEGQQVVASPVGPRTFDRCTLSQNKIAHCGELELRACRIAQV